MKQQESDPGRAEVKYENSNSRNNKNMYLIQLMFGKYKTKKSKTRNENGEMGVTAECGWG